MISEGDALVSPQQAPLALLHRVLHGITASRDKDYSVKSLFNDTGEHDLWQLFCFLNRAFLWHLFNIFLPLWTYQKPFYIRISKCNLSTDIYCPICMTLYEKLIKIFVIVKSFNKKKICCFYMTHIINNLFCFISSSSLSSL